ncbi:type IV toxin-antitoxin system AbiEi family antitoxin domain-containing protein [Streptomyces sp. DSM 110735]|nr:type IV toxin-antitoxin system AbiEi family antitoxin domain-containing protein [Streptomyces sp. DSM 110735]
MAALSGAAADQWGLVTAAQAKGLGVNGVQLSRLTEAGLLSSVGRGVYLLTAVGVPSHLDMKVAWLRLQPKQFLWERPVGDPDSGVVSHASACQLLDLGDIPAPEVEISVPRRRTTTEPFVRLRTAQVGTTEITTVDGLPVTTAVRTITDLLHAGVDGGHIGGVIADAERRGLITVDDLSERAQPFSRKYGLKVDASGYDLIDHLVAQAGESLRRQEVDRASREGFDQAVQLLAERPELIELMRATRAAARQQHNLSPTVPALNPALMELIRKLSQPNPASMESIRKLTRPDPAIRAAMRKTMPNPALMESIRKMMPDPGTVRAIQQAAALPLGILKAPERATAPKPTPERTSPLSGPSETESTATSGGGSQEPDGTSSQGPEGPDIQTN